MRLLAFVLCLPLFLTAQFAPPAGVEGSSAIHKDSSIIVSWATHCVVERGWQDISNPDLGQVNTGENWMANGLAGANGVVSLGDGGSALIGFERSIINGPSWDFVIFENGFSDTFLELAFVEVSSDGENYFRFPAFSHTQTSTQIDAFGAIDARQIHNLAGKYRALWGTPFDLDELPNNELLDKNNITHLRLIDVVGSIDPMFASFDSEGNIINDPFPTPFPSSGFDLDAVGVIHQGLAQITENETLKTQVYPNPTNDLIYIQTNFSECELSIFGLDGRVIYKSNLDQEISSLHLSNILSHSGVYVLRFTHKLGISEKFIHYDAH